MYNNEETTERFHCPICNKSYLRKRHLQRHMRDECIGIPPRFHCEICPSKFRRKYHLVRHLQSKHGIITPKVEKTTVKFDKNIKIEDKLPQQQQQYNNSVGVTNGQSSDHLSVNALLMKKENYENFLPDIKQIQDISRVLVNIQSQKNYGSNNMLNIPEPLPYLQYISQMKFDSPNI